MTDNVVDFPNPDEVIGEEDQAEQDFDAGFTLGREIYAKARREIEALETGKSYAFQDGLWDGFLEN